MRPDPGRRPEAFAIAARRKLEANQRQLSPWLSAAEIGLSGCGGVNPARFISAAAAARWHDARLAENVLVRGDRAYAYSTAGLREPFSIRLGRELFASRSLPRSARSRQDSADSPTISRRCFAPDPRDASDIVVDDIVARCRGSRGAPQHEARHVGHRQRLAFLKRSPA